MDNQRAVCKMEEDFVKCRANLTMEFPTTGLRSGLWTASTRNEELLNEGMDPIVIRVEAEHQDTGRLRFRATLLHEGPINRKARLSLEVRKGDKQVYSTLDKTPKLTPGSQVILGLSTQPWTIPEGSESWSAELRLILYLKKMFWARTILN